jgi:Bax protein
VVGTPVPGRFQMRAFESIVEAVSAYAMNLNTHFAYRKFRQQRAEMRNKDALIDGYVLAGTLLAYSERGQDYIDFLRLIMRTENLRPLDEARLQR